MNESKSPPDDAREAASHPVWQEKLWGPPKRIVVLGWWLFLLPLAIGLAFFLVLILFALNECRGIEFLYFLLGFAVVLALFIVIVRELFRMTWAYRYFDERANDAEDDVDSDDVEWREAPTADADSGVNTHKDRPTY